MRSSEFAAENVSFFNRFLGLVEGEREGVALSSVSFMV